MSAECKLVVRSERSELKAALAKIQIEGVTFSLVDTKGKDSCVETLVKDDSALLVIDWSLGSVEVNQILAATKRHYKVEVRSILMVINDLDPRVVATAIEYGVSQVHSGPLVPETLGQCLRAMIAENIGENPIRDTLIQVAAGREKGNWDLVTSMLDNLHDQNPSNARITVELASNLIHEKDWGRAVALLKPLVEAEVPHLRALHLLGRCYLGMGQHEAAVEVLRKAKLFNPDHVDRLLDLGHALMAHDQPEDAKAQFTEALAIEPDSKPAQTGQAQAMLMMGEVNEALVLLKQVSGSREMASIFNAAAILSVKNQHFDKGRDLYLAALRALGNDHAIAARLFYNLGLAYKKWDKPEKAKAAFSKSNELDPSFAKVQRHVKGGVGDKPTPSSMESSEFHEEYVQKSDVEKKGTKTHSGATTQEIDKDGLIRETEDDEWSPIDASA